MLKNNVRLVSQDCTIQITLTIQIYLDLSSGSKKPESKINNPKWKKKLVLVKCQC